MRDVIVEFSYDRFLVGHTNGLDYHYIAFTHCLHRNVTAVTTGIVTSFTLYRNDFYAIL